MPARLDPTRGARVAGALRERWFAGITRNGVVLVTIACLVNALRRVAPGVIAGEPWLAQAAEFFGTGLILVSIPLLAAVMAIDHVPASPRWRYPALAIAIVTGTLVGMTIAGLVEARGWSGLHQQMTEDGGAERWLRLRLLRYGVLILLLAAVLTFYRLREEHETATRQAELSRVRSEQQLDEARLAMLQAQIEPHFLFNTLATVRRLYQTDAAAAEAMLSNLMRYLAVALPEMRAASSTLGREAALAESYLEIQRMRMGRRLEFAIDIPQALREAAMPPMMLLTLVENAIKHGVAPVPEGGSVRVSAAAGDGELRLQVADSGQGFTKTSGGGTGLANIRARLAGLYGRAAQVALTQNRPRGVIATIALPYPASAARP